MKRSRKRILWGKVLPITIAILLMVFFAPKVFENIKNFRQANEIQKTHIRESDKVKNRILSTNNDLDELKNPFLRTQLIRNRDKKFTNNNEKLIRIYKNLDGVDILKPFDKKDLINFDIK